MSKRDIGFVALGRFLAVECYRDSQLPSPTYALRSSGADRTAGNTGKPDPGNASGGAPSSRMRAGADG
jgi:hypothetical protein